MGGGCVLNFSDRTFANFFADYDTSKANANAKGFRGAIFDGRYVYFVPFNSGAPDGVAARFDAKAPPSMPKGYSGSFY